MLENLVRADKIEAVYTHYDRMIIGAANPVDQLLELETYEELRAENFLDRREIGIVNTGGNGTITVDGERFNMEKLDCLYIGKGKKKVNFLRNKKLHMRNSFSFLVPHTRNFPLD